MIQFALAALHVITALRNLELTVMQTLNVKVINVHHNNSNSVLFPDIIRVSINLCDNLVLQGCTSIKKRKTLSVSTKYCHVGTNSVFKRNE